MTTMHIESTDSGGANTMNIGGFDHHGMATSFETTKLHAAMAKVQADIKNPGLDSINPHYKSKYASLASILDAIRSACAPHGVSFSQHPCSTDGRYGVQSIIRFQGEWERSELLIKPERDNAHGIGSATTYARKYSAAAIFAIAGEEDDDGNAAVQPKTQPKGSATRTVPKADEPSGMSIRQTTAAAFQKWTGIENIEDLTPIFAGVFKSLKMRRKIEKIIVDGKETGETKTLPFTDKQWQNLLDHVTSKIDEGIAFADIHLDLVPEQ